MRRVYRTTAPDNTGEWLIPVLEPSEQQGVQLRNATVPSAGQDGAYDLYGSDRAPREPSIVELEFVLHGEGATPGDSLQTAISTMYAGLGGAQVEDARRKLWSREADGTDLRFAYAKLQSLDLPKERKNILYARASAELLLPDPTWYEPITAVYLAGKGLTDEDVPSNEVGEPIAPDLTFAWWNTVTSPLNFTLTNEGDLATRRLIVRLESNAVNGFTNPTLTNNTTGQSWSSTTDGALSTTVLSVNCVAGLGRARVSANSGVSWLDDTLNLSLGVTQAVIMELVPGANSMTFTSEGTVDTDVLAWWAHGWRD